MSNEDPTVEKVWKFYYEGRDKKCIEGTFVASQDEIDWITGQVINFGDSGNGLNTVITMDADYFQVVNEDEQFVEQFKATIGTIGMSPFKMLDDEQLSAHDLAFGVTYVNGIPVEADYIQSEFVDEDNHVITYGITEALFHEYTDSHFQEELERFYTLFKIVEPQGYAVHLRQREEKYSDGGLACVKVIKRKSDGMLFGYPYTETRGEEINFYANGGLFSAGKDDRLAYVWFPVESFTIKGYEISR